MNFLRRVAAALARAIDRWLAEEFPIAPATLPKGLSAGTDYTITAVESNTITLGTAPGAPPISVESAGHGLVLGDSVRIAAPRSGPLFVADFSHWDGDVDCDAYVADPRYVGVWIKLTQGARGYEHEMYGVNLARRMLLAAKKRGRLGVDFKVGGYGYLDFDADGAPQANYLFRAHRDAGILDAPRAGRLRAMMDVERGQPGSPNYDDRGAEVRACAEAFAARWVALTGAPPIAYGRGTWEDLRLSGLLGCSGLVNPAYIGRMPAMDGVGVPRAKVRGWQYTDGESNRTNFPTVPPGAKRGDTTVLLGERSGQLATTADVERLLAW